MISYRLCEALCTTLIVFSGAFTIIGIILLYLSVDDDFGSLDFDLLVVGIVLVIAAPFGVVFGALSACGYFKCHTNNSEQLI